MDGSGIILDAFQRVRETLHTALPGLTPEELLREPHPPIGWLAWRLTRVQDSQCSRLAGREQAWIGDGWHSRFNMPPVAIDFGPSLTHTREQVAAFKVPGPQLLLDYYDTVFERTKLYLAALTPQDLDRQLDEPQFQPRPTVAVRLVSVVATSLQGTGQIVYLRGLIRRGGWFPREGQ